MLLALMVALRVALLRRCARCVAWLALLLRSHRRLVLSARLRCHDPWHVGGRRSCSVLAVCVGAVGLVLSRRWRWHVGRETRLTHNPSDDADTDMPTRAGFVLCQDAHVLDAFHGLRGHALTTVRPHRTCLGYSRGLLGC